LSIAGTAAVGVRTRLFRFHRDIIAPDRRGLRLSIARTLLRFPAALYRVAVSARNKLYDSGWKRSRRADVPVISVGNVTAGGTGKTPLVAWLARLMVIRKMRPAILSRGYGRDPATGLDDENRMLQQQAQDVPIVVDPDRVRGAEEAISQHRADVLILDDGFQHRRIHRDLDLVLVDALWPFGAGNMLPRGLLREPLSGLARADFLLITRSDLVTRDRLEAIRTQLRALSPHAPICCCRTSVMGLLPVAGESQLSESPSVLEDGRWAAFCGIGNPEGFRLMLELTGCHLASFTVFGDHESYTLGMVDDLLSRARKAECTGLLTTEKDAVKVRELLPREVSPPVYAVQTDLDFTENSDALTAAIIAAVQPRQ
jgi:tetraacyldisaccharide 4'-kinase